MLAFKNRFHGYGSLKYVYKNGQSVRGQLFTLKFSNNTKRTTPRVAVVVSKKIMKRAVGRNTIRRKMYEVVRGELDEISPSLDIVWIICSSEVHSMDHQALKNQIINALKEARLYKSGQKNDIL